MTGDKNERSRYFCYIAQHSILYSANGGSWSNNRCNQPPAPLAIDWMLGTSDVRFDSYTAFRDDLVRKTTDHPIVMANATIAPRTPPIADHVVVLAVQGLRSLAVQRAGSTGAPALADMRATGASTLNARSEVERTSRAANVIGMLTGRPVNPLRGGHGVGWRPKAETTVHAAAGHYVSQRLRPGARLRLPDLLPVQRRRPRHRRPQLGQGRRQRRPLRHEQRPQQALPLRDAPHRPPGGEDPRRRARRARGPHPRRRPPRPSGGGSAHRYGWRSPEYAAAVTRVSALVGRVQQTIAETPGLAGRTLLVVTADSGADSTTDSDPTTLPDYRIPFFATGPSVPAGTDVYALNPHLTQARSRPGGL